MAYNVHILGVNPTMSPDENIQLVFSASAEFYCVNSLQTILINLVPEK